MNWIISLFHVFLLFLDLWGGYWWFALFITPFFLFSLFLWFSSTYQSLSWLFGFFLKKTSNNEKAQIIHSISTPQSVYILLLFGWYLLLVSGYHNWIDPTLQVYVLSILVSGYIAFIWYCFSFFLEFHFLKIVSLSSLLHDFFAEFSAWFVQIFIIVFFTLFRNNGWYFLVLLLLSYSGYLLFFNLEFIFSLVHNFSLWFLALSLFSFSLLSRE